MATGPLGDSPVEPLQAERDALAARCAEAEELLSEAMAELAVANERIAELEAATEGPMSIFDQPADLGPSGGFARDGSDPRVLSMLMAATAVVAGLVAVLALLNGNLGTPFGFAMILTALGLAWAAARTRIQGVEVSISNGVVYIEKGESSYRFDVRNEGTKLEMQGSPGDSYWQVRFYRKGMDPFVVDTDMVDAEEFVRQLREWRPQL
ncbi:hypothetical protein F0U44_04165 [Nocardioides humilatus]|uniref:Uncharacterized protein n=1 Tax=Nocardioides humilatus TaxID=2607660 RepID=A0A5B1LLA4_9ACTN|nr:hypothetical protein [Nocardioides humilatus]KAA1421492.1 hypothetical protein F0U44_04165 [Nocardioides humilatus]